ncbi:hypothetical protein AQ490_22635 [Wenjunlia vitaminophila]|uniref:YdbS-like PH domain-containing protein n=1 Tax=Wenjunlia vitaminophila TaxID=76728 RepID=A0A0T6LSQ3_WENVI|nr:PH domain-containing protein [Wenjunlia vitaminophila]KRV48929.1 hypothetical protein AQ490_22635 [Wenjunlia vitaminophila]
MDPAFAPPATGWTMPSRALLRMRRVVLVAVAAPVTAAVAVPVGLLVSPALAAVALVPAALAAWAWRALGRNWRSWGYAEREDDLLVRRGVLWRRLTVVPYGRMQLVEVVAGPLQRHWGIATLELHTAAATTDAAIPGLLPPEAARLRDRLTELGEARSAGL